MDRQKITDALGIPPGTSLYLTKLDFLVWGNNLYFAAIAGEDMAFSLQFRDCREWRWQTYTHIESAGEPFPRTELVNFRLGRSQHRSPAHLLTEHFGLSLFYGDVLLVRDGEEFRFNQ
ncbi:MAG: hypothetical protein KC496_00275 [Anaerolineae bacterium]|nr:hypothetical protein [Anaerolineae bacterium]